jgi:hypothetical protein
MEILARQRARSSPALASKFFVTAIVTGRAEYKVRGSNQRDVIHESKHYPFLTVEELPVH